MNQIKNSSVLVAVFVTVFVGMFAGSARAQETMVVTVPFPFVVLGQQMPAGRYDITSDRGVLSIEGTHNNKRMLALTQSADGRDPAGEQPALVFVRREHTNLLTQIWESPSEGLALPQRSATATRDRASVRSDSSFVLASGIDVIGK